MRRIERRKRRATKQTAKNANTDATHGKMAK